MITLTRNLVYCNRTPKGAWTRAQLEAIGVQWPPRYGWLSQLDGRQFTEEQWRKFMAGRFIHADQLRQIKRKEKLRVQETKEPETILSVDVQEWI